MGKGSISWQASLLDLVIRLSVDQVGGVKSEASTFNFPKEYSKIRF